jgi:putative tricarboxylic transport membrane protein
MLYGGLMMDTVPKKGDIGSAFVPDAIGGLVIFLSILLMVSAWLGKEKNAKEDTEQQNAPYHYKSVWLTMALTVGYMIALVPIGFVVSSTIYLFLQMIIMAKKSGKKQLVLYALISLVMPFLVNYIFYEMFSLMLPAGILG